MMRRLLVASLLVLAAYSSGGAQTPQPPYGPPIDLALAKRVMAAAEAEATRNNWTVAIAIVDISGDLVMLQRLDNANLSATRIARGKARTALEFRRPTKALEEAIAAGGPGLRLLAIEGVTPIEGGLPLVADGKIIGAIGVSGGAASQDGQVGKVGADAIK
ncbi:MAG: heme-binding protein [Alphaproteobacteria bacterium]|nr:heme-binding protein [Alphaproteobacteria bacterium]